MKTAIIAMILVLLGGCASVRSVSQTSIPAKRTNVVKAEVSKNIIFLFNFSTNYLDDLTAQLQKACPNGKVEGILTKDVTIVYFPIIFHKDLVTAEGYCDK